MTEEEIEALKSHRKIKAAGVRMVAGIASEGVFAKVPAEISYMDANTTKWSYIELKEGHLPEQEQEIIMDEAAPCPPWGDAQDRGGDHSYLSGVG